MFWKFRVAAIESRQPNLRMHFLPGNTTMDDAIRKAETLIEALSYIRNFRDKRTLIKLGGSAMEDAAALRATLQDVVFMETVGMRPILVHGGGKAIDRAMAEAGLKPEKVLGRRRTDDATLKIVVDVLVNQINASIVRQIRDHGGRAVGLCNGTLKSLFGEKLILHDESGRPVDLGRVGRITSVDSALIEDLCAAGVVPVIPSLAVDADGEWLNVNADSAAAAVACHLRAEKLVFLTDTPGILLEPGNEASLVSSLDASECPKLIRQGIITGGMIPKVEACLESLQAGVRKTHVIDGRLKHSLLLEIYTDRGVGTQIVGGKKSPGQ
ncbi:MAG: acetylglutamate kinase [Gemmatales bacterium]|nr:MAG: acetylglutamate kinase [Gemmatales bacterium]